MERSHHFSWKHPASQAYASSMALWNIVWNTEKRKPTQTELERAEKHIRRAREAAQDPRRRGPSAEHYAQNAEKAYAKIQKRK